MLVLRGQARIGFPAMRLLLRLLPLLCLALPATFPRALHAVDAPTQEPPAAFEIREGDRIVLLGDTLLEREGNYGFLETRMVEQFPDRKFTVRNISWSGDTPHGVSRAMFDGPEKGWERLKEQIAAEKPTVVFLGYGMASVLQELTDRANDVMLNRDIARYGRDPMTADRFKKELGELIDAITAVDKSVRLVLLSPIRSEDMRLARPGLPDPTELSRLLDAYSKVIEDTARDRGARFVSLKKVVPSESFHTIQQKTGLLSRELSIPGGDEGRLLALQNYPLTTNSIHLHENGYRALAMVAARELGWAAAADPKLPAGPYHKAEAEEAFPPEPLREAIVRKNQLFFHRFRPENWTYLFGFRKHEQGQNAVEIPKFDPLIAAAEQEIERLKKLSPADRAAVLKKESEVTAAKTEATPPVPKELPKFDVEKGFAVDLWATNPLLEKPIGINWDSDGRLWVASSNTYPQVNPEDVAASLEAQVAGAKKDAPATGNDKILIIEDPDHTGKATKSSVFADGLLIPTGVAPFRDAQGHWGCYVGASSELIELVDTKGTGKADRRRVVLSSFGTEDTHQNVHTLRWGPDGQLYLNQSIYPHSHFETPWGMVRLNSGGVISWDPRSERVEVHYKGFCNPWGHVWDEWGQEFVSDGAGFEGINWGITGAMYFTYENGRKILDSISPGTYPKFASLELVHSPLFPDDWQGTFITNDFRAHRIVHFGLNDLSLAEDPAAAKSGYITKELPDLVRTSDLSFRPVDVKQGPDGALYVADWSNPVINHGEVDFRDPRRDHYSGRIWRIAQSDKKPLTWKALTNEPADSMKDLLSSKNEWEKEQARIVVTHGQTYTPAGEETLGMPPSFLENKDPRVRAQAARLTGMALWQDSYQRNESERAYPRMFMQSIGALIKDANPRVRVEVMRTLARSNRPDAPGQVLDAAINAPADDKYYEYAAWLSINDLAEPWTKAVIAGEWKIEGHEKQLEFALAAIDPALASDVLHKVMAAREIPADGGPWIDLISKAGGAAELRKLFEVLITQKLDPAASSRAIDALREAVRLRHVQPSGDLSGIEALLSHADVKISGGAARLLGAWKLPKALDLLNGMAAGGNRNATPTEVRLAAIDGLREIGGEKALGLLGALTSPDQAIAIRRSALVAATQVNVKAGVNAAGPVLAAIADESSALETWRGLLQVKGAPEAFAAHLPENLPPVVASAGLRAAREAGKNGAALAKALSAKTGAPAEAPASQDYTWLVNLVKRDGDPAKGEMIFRRAQLVCLTCHAIGGAGGKVGPELTSLGASAPLDYIIESVFVPNAKVKEGYNAVSFTLKDGTITAGVQSRETPQEIFVRTVTGQETGIAKSNIASRENIGSLMPAGLIDTLQEREKVDLFAFLSQLGKPGPFDASKGNVARYWGLSSAVSGGGPITPGYTLVDGRFTRDLLAATLPMVPGAGKSVMATAKFQAPNAGEVKILLEGVSEALIDGKRTAVQAGSPMAVSLTTGEHLLSVTLDPKNLPEFLRAECSDVRFVGN